MKRKTILTASILLLFFCAAANAARVEGSYEKLIRKYQEDEAAAAAKKKAKEPKSIWDDDTEANPYFQKQKTKSDKPKTEEKKKVREPKRSTFKRRVYTGPSKEEIAASATEKAIENFKSFMALDGYEMKYDRISYNVRADSLTVGEVVFSPVQEDERSVPVPYALKADEIVLRSFNIGEKNGKPMLKNGEMTVKKMEIPVWNEKAVKKGKVEIAQLKMKGDLAAFLEAKEGELETVEVKGLRSEAIINETILDNIVRSKVFAASSAHFKEAVLQKEIIDSLKQQDINGLTFSFAQINGQQIPTLDGVKAAMTSYSARILNKDLVLGARLEKEKGNPDANPDLEQLKKNVMENQAAIAAIEAESEKQKEEAEKQESEKK